MFNTFFCRFIGEQHGYHDNGYDNDDKCTGAGILFLLGANDELPQIKGNVVKSGKVESPATSVSFITFADAGNTIAK